MILSRTNWAAMDAWSTPGTHSVSSPRMRWYRMRTSCAVTNRAWPVCSEPVTLGGGMVITNRSAPSGGSAAGVNAPLANQRSYTRDSTSPAT